MKFISYFLSLLMLAGSAAGQIAPGSWRMHLPYNQAIGLDESGNKIMVAAVSGIFSFNRDDGSLEVLNKVNGLNDVGISAFARHPARDLFMVGYENGNIDVIQGNSIINLPEIINSSILGSRKINRIHFSGNLAYVSCDFGLVVYNIDKQEIKESNTGLGQSGKTIKVLDCLKFSDTLYAITEEGLKVLPPGIPIKNSNLWIPVFGDAGIPANPNDLYTIDSLDQQTLILGSAFGLHTRSGNQFSLKAGLGGRIRSVRKRNNRILVCVENNVVEFDGSADNRIQTLDPEYYKKISLPTGAILDNAGVYWVSDFYNGLLRIAPGDTSRILPNGPLFPDAFSLSAYKDKIVLHAGGFTYPTGNYDNKNPGGFAIFSNGEWKTFNSQTTPGMPDVRDIVRSFFDPAEQQLYLSTFGYGILTMKENGEFGIMNDSTTNGGLCNIFIPDCIYNASNPDEANLGKIYIRITSSCKDAYGNLWATCFNNTKGSVRYYSVSDQEWKTLFLPSTNDEFPMEIITDQYDQKWIRMAPGMQSDFAAIWVLDQTGEKKLKLSNVAGFGDLPSNEIYDIKMDKSGYIWVGTTKGLAVFYNPGNAFYSNGINASKPIFPPEAGRPVLENDVVTSIEIDGANRKWIGTKDNGIWLFNEDISQVIKQFNKSNSPLISNFIYDISINKATGEVFFATDKGLVSYQGDATENLDGSGNPLGSTCDESRIKVFPNPVPRNHEGSIAVQGLAPNSEVKILSPSGKLIYKTNSRGSMATWNGYTYDGKKVPPGVYIMVSSTPDGQAGCSSKFAILD